MNVSGHNLRYMHCPAPFLGRRCLLRPSRSRLRRSRYVGSGVSVRSRSVPGGSSAGSRRLRGRHGIGRSLGFKVLTSIGIRCALPLHFPRCLLPVAQFLAGRTAFLLPDRVSPAPDEFFPVVFHVPYLAVGTPVGEIQTGGPAHLFHG
ncbi:hypothetical protein SF83666_b54700 (plasmid) [Sinorhizobium fredii CCBAU 83666]|nr:hypothetical protein SF83666_b54700 [Sinorhizobium fredii CCBAU 83666]